MQVGKYIICGSKHNLLFTFLLYRSMLQSFSGGDIIHIDKSLSAFYAHFIFYYNTNFHFHQIHLLEHLLLNPDRVLASSGKTVKEMLAGIGHLNGFTGGAFISFNIEIIPEYALTMLEVLREVLHSPLEVSPEERLHELYIFQQEEIFQKEAYGFDIQGIEKYYTNTKRSGIQNGLRLDNMTTIHEQLIFQQKPLVIIQAAAEKPPIQNAMQWLKEKFSSTQPEKLTPQTSSNTNRQYQPQRMEFEEVKTSRLFKCYLATSNTHHSQGRILNQLTLAFFREVWFEYLRYIEQSDYDLDATHRFMPYGWQMGLRFYTRASSEDLQELIQQQFHKKAEDFHQLQSQIYNQTMILADQPIRAYYYIMQEYFFTGKYRTIQDIAADMKRITYQEFVTHYEKMIPDLSWEIA